MWEVRTVAPPRWFIHWSTHWYSVALWVVSLSHLSVCQDESNRNGGKWIIRLRKGLASRFWENIILAMLGEQFMVGEEICGAVVSIRFQVLRHDLLQEC